MTDLEDISEDFQIEFESLPFVYLESVESVMLSQSIQNNLKSGLSLDLSRIESSIAFSNVKSLLLWNKFQIKFGLLTSNGRQDSAKICHIQFIYKNQEQSPNISQGFEESPKTPIFYDDPLNESPHEESTPQGSSSNMRQTHTPFEHLGKWTKDRPIANVIDDPSRFVSTRKQLQTDAMWCFFDAFLTSVEPKNFKEAMTELLWIDAMQEEIHEFERLPVWELVPCPNKVLLIKLKWIYKVKTDEFGEVLKNKARLVAQGFRQE
ncbi:retrovirus-related pol polyprotein from transposon TNT 1-94 [Tanacetum coccineum]